MLNKSHLNGLFDFIVFIESKFMNGGIPFFIFIFVIMLISGIIYAFKGENKGEAISKNEKRNPTLEKNKNTIEQKVEYSIYSKVNNSETIIEKKVIEGLKKIVADHPDKLVGGYLIGDQEELISDYIPLENISINSKFEFNVDTKQQFIEISKIAKAKKIILGQFLSKINEPAYPSEFDLKNAVTPNISYLYISLGSNLKNEVRAFAIDHISKQVKERVIVLK